MYAYLWTPADLLRLDAEPFLARELRRVASSSVRPCRDVRRTHQLIALTEGVIEAIRELPDYDQDAALAFLARRTLLRARMGRTPFAWVHARAAD